MTDGVAEPPKRTPTRPANTAELRVEQSPRQRTKRVSDSNGDHSATPAPPKKRAASQRTPKTRIERVLDDAGEQSSNGVASTFLERPPLVGPPVLEAPTNGSPSNGAASNGAASNGSASNGSAVMLAPILVDDPQMLADGDTEALTTLVMPVPDTESPASVRSPVDAPADDTEALMRRQVQPARPLRSIQMRTRPRIRRVTRVVRHVDTWSVFKVALVFNIFLYIVCLTAGVLLWQVAYTTGTVDNIENFFLETGWKTFELKGGEIYHQAWIAGLFVSAGLTGLAVLMATMFNLITDLVGGIRVSVLEEEVVARGERQMQRKDLRAARRQARERERQRENEREREKSSAG